MFGSRQFPHGDDVVGFGPYRLDRSSGVLYRDGEEIPLSLKAIEVLTCLVERPHKTVSKTELLERVWEGTSVTDQSLIEAVRQLRQALDDDAQRPTYIKTAHRKGYRFIAAVSAEEAGRAVGKEVRVAPLPGILGRGLHSLAGSERLILKLSVVLLAVVATAATLGLWRYWSMAQTPSLPLAVRRVPLSLPANFPAVGGLAISPDGSEIAYVAAVGDNTQIVRKEPDEFEFTPVAGTEGARGWPSFSPDGQEIAFKIRGDAQTAGWTINKVSVGGSPPIPLASFNTGNPALTWASDDNIYIALGDGGGIYRVSAGGGNPESLRAPGRPRVRANSAPTLLPDGRTLLFTSVSTAATDRPGRAVLLSLVTGEENVLLEGVSGARYVPTGHLLYNRNGSKWARPFDASTHGFRGEEIRLNSSGPPTAFAVSGNGTHAYIETSGQRSRAVQVDLNGNRRSLSPRTEGCLYPSLSPDGKQLALACDWSGSDIVLGDLARGVFARWASDGEDFTPIWTPDGAAITYSSYRDGSWSLRTRAADGRDGEEVLLESDDPLYPSSWSPDGEALLFQWIRPDTGEDIWLLPAGGEGTPTPWLSSSHHESGARFSPNGQWVVYHSNESGRWHVYAQEFDGRGGKLALSSEPGGWPVWSRDGRALYYVSNPGNGPMIIDIEPGPGLRAGSPRPLGWDRIGALRNRQGPAFDVAPDGESFFLVGPEQTAGRAASEIRVVFGWFEELKQLVPTGR